MYKKELNSISIARFKQMLNSSNGIENDFIIHIGTNLEGLNVFQYPCRLDAVAFAICTKGEVTTTINLQEYKITQGMMIINSPQNIIQVNHNKKEVEVKIIIVSSSFMNEINTKSIIPLYVLVQKKNCIQLSMEEAVTMNEFFCLIQKIIDTANPHKREMTQNLILAMMYYLSDIILKNSDLSSDTELPIKTRKEQFFEKFISLLSSYHKTERTVGFYANKLNITPKYFSAIIKEMSGKSAAEWIDNYVVLEAKALLKFSGMSIQDIAYYLNFSTQSSFGKYFKHKTGISPSNYKQS
ncbi:MAG: helix-turn-helix domain-containing protein [Rikenellaceae bacterium]